MYKYLIFSLLFFFSSSASAIGLPEFPFIIVSGKAEVKVPPDEVRVTFSIIEFNSSSESALSVVIDRGAAVLKLAEKYNIPFEQITSQSIDKTVKRSRDANYEQLEILGYEVSQSYNIRIKDISNYSKFSDELISMQNIANVNSSFNISNRDEVLRKLVNKASSDAFRRANDLAKGLRANVGSVFAISEDLDIGLQLAKFGVNVEGYATYSKDSVSSRRRFNFFIPKTIDISKTVNVIFKLEQ